MRLSHFLLGPPCSGPRRSFGSSMYDVSGTGAQFHWSRMFSSPLRVYMLARSPHGKSLSVFGTRVPPAPLRRFTREGAREYLVQGSQGRSVFPFSCENFVLR